MKHIVTRTLQILLAGVVACNTVLAQEPAPPQRISKERNSASQRYEINQTFDGQAFRRDNNVWTPTMVEASGVLDRSFASGGIFKISIDGQATWASGSAFQSDGKLVVVASPSDANYTTHIALIRLNIDGSLDKKFGKEGIVETRIGINSRANNIAILQDGKIAVVGWSLIDQQTSGITLVMYRQDGTLDLDFASSGVLMLPKKYDTSFPTSIAIQRDQKILLGGKITLRTNQLISGLWHSVSSDFFFLTRVNVNGSLDINFGEAGVVMTDVGGNQGGIENLALTLEGRIIATGITQKNSKSKMIVARYLESGVLDPGFGDAGRYEREIEQERFTSVRGFVLANGDLLVVGGQSTALSIQNLIAFKLNNTGRINLNYGKIGFVLVPTEFWRYSPLRVKIVSEDSLLVAGLLNRPLKEGQRQPPYFFSYGISRFQTDGQVDRSFAKDGMLTVDVGTKTDLVTSVELGSSGQLMVIGSSDNQSSKQLVVFKVTNRSLPLGITEANPGKLKP